MAEATPHPQPGATPPTSELLHGKGGMSRTRGGSRGGPPAPLLPWRSEAQGKESHQNTGGGVGRAPSGRHLPPARDDTCETLGV